MHPLSKLTMTGTLFMSLLLLLSAYTASAHNYNSTSKLKLASLGERFNQTTGPPRGSDIHESDEQGTAFPSDGARLPRIRGRMAYDDGSGTYVGSDEVHHYGSGVKCWSDYFLVDSGYSWAPWRKASGNVYCTDTSACSIQHMDGYQTCETWSISVSAGVEAKFFSLSVTLGYQHETCHSGSDTTQCQWNDQDCHCIWTQQQMTYQHGYKRRRCSSSNGDYTASMQDVVHDAPTAVVSYGCGSKCTDT